MFPRIMLISYPSSSIGMPLRKRKSELEEGETYTAVIDRISRAGNAIINIFGEDRHINLGQVDCDRGTRIDFEVTKITNSNMIAGEFKSRNSSPDSTGLVDGLDAESLTSFTDEQEERDEANENKYKSPPKKNDLISRRKP